MSRPYIPRILDGELDELLAGLAAIAVEGAKAVGKSVTLGRRAARVLRLDDPDVAAVVAAAPAESLRPPHPVLLDEWQRVPAVWDAVRRLVDDTDTPNQVLLAGSATPRHWPAHSGAGRIVRLRMRPLAISERLAGERLPNAGRAPAVSVRALLTGQRPPVAGDSPWRLTHYAREIVASGFPAIRALSPRLRRAQLDGYVAHLLTRDLEEEQGVSANPETVRRWLRAYAAASGTTTSLEKIRDAATAGDGPPPAKTTGLRYRDALEALWILDPVPAWSPAGTALRRLGQAPKVHLADPALAAHLLGVDEDALVAGAANPLAGALPTVRDGPLFGALFESFVLQSLHTYAQAAEAAVHHVRTQNGDHEVDALLVRRDQRVVACEVKLRGAVTDADVRHLHWLRERLGDAVLDAVVVHTGPTAYRRPDGIAVVPAALLGP